MPIRFPSFCYKLVSDSAAALSDEALGPLNVEASLTAGHARYETPQENTKKLQKTIIFNACEWAKQTLQFFPTFDDVFEQSLENTPQSNQFLAILHQLLQEGFFVYISKKSFKEFQLLIHANITYDFFHFCSDGSMQSYPNDKLIQLAQQIKLNGKHSFDDFLVLDGTHMAALIQSLSEQPEAKKICHLVQDDNYVETTYSCFPLMPIEIDVDKQVRFIHAVYTSSHPSIKDCIKTDIDSVSWHPKWKPSSINDKKDWLLGNLSSRGIRLVLVESEESTQNAENQAYLRRVLPYTTSLYYDNNPFDIPFIDCWNRTPQLRELEASIPDLELLQLPIKNGLESMTLTHCRSIKTLSTLLLSAPNLRRLELNVHKLNSAYGVPQVLNTSLTKMVFRSSDLEFRSALHMIQAMPQLKTLGLDNCQVAFTKEDELTYSKTGLCPEVLCDFSQLNTLMISIFIWREPLEELIHQIIVNAKYLRCIDLSLCSLSNIKPILNLLAKLDFFQRKSCEIIYPESYKTTTLISSHRTNHFIDADTSPRTQVFNPKTLFRGLGCPNPLPNNYRLNVTRNCQMNPNPCSIKEAFSINFDDPNDSLVETSSQAINSHEIKAFIEKASQTQSSNHLYVCEMRLLLNTTWKALPSLKPYDEMLYYSVSDFTEHDINHLVEIKYCEDDNLYYIRTKEQHPIDAKIDFIIQHDAEKMDRDDVNQNLYIQSIFDYFHHFREDMALDMGENHSPSGEQYAQSILEQKTGVCRHRAMACIYLIKKYPEFDIRYIENDLHAYVEIKPPKQDWITLDLGGSTTDLIVPQPFGVIVPPAPKPKKYFLRPATQLYPTPEAYGQHLLTRRGNCLIETSSPNTTDKLCFLLQQEALKKQIPCFVVRDPDELSCPSTSIKLQGPTDKVDCVGRLVKAPGGSLYQFISSQGDNFKLIVVDFDAFTPANKVRCNSCFDKVPHIDSMTLPKNTQFIVIQQHDSDSSLHSRFQRHERTLPACIDDYTYPEIILRSESPTLTSSSSSSTNYGEELVIDLYGSETHWKHLLLGQWYLTGSTLTYKKGPLIQALELINAGKKIHITLLNPPKDTPDYLRFWRQLSLTQHLSYGNGLKNLTIPDGLIITVRAEETFTVSMKKMIRSIDLGSPPSKSSVLNATCFRDFFWKDVINNTDKSLHQKPGVLFEHNQPVMNIYVSDNLSMEQWREYLNTCQQNNVFLNLYCAPKVLLPQSLLEGTALEVSFETLIPPKSFSVEEIRQSNVSFIKSSDRDVTIAQLKLFLDKPPKIFEISEKSPNDLLHHIEGKLVQESTPTFHFETRDGGLLAALDRGESVILHGHLSKSLQHALTAWFVEEAEQKLTQGKLIVIASDSEENPFLGLPNISTYSHEVSIEEKKQLVYPPFAMELNWSLPLTQLLAYVRCKTSNPWAGMETLPPLETAYTWPVQWSELTEENAALFEQRRQLLVEQILACSPYVFLAGVSGVGKTSFVRKYFQGEQGRLYEGENNILSWATDKNPGRKVLFIDEANITTQDWTDFEALFDSFPSILINGLNMDLTPDHKVVFAGNPVSYSEDRHQPSLFERHGNSVVFDPLSLAFLFQRVLKPALEQMGIDNADVQKAIATPILHAAVFLTQQSLDTILITPRELESMALLTGLRCLTSPPEILPIDQYTTIAKHYVSILAESFVPSASLQAFHALFPAKPEQFSAPKSTSDFTFTATNSLAGQILNDFLDLRDHHISNISLAFSGRDFLTGVGGILIEGEPGIGKSELAETIIKQRKLIPAPKGNWQISNPDRVFYYHVEPIMSLRDKEDLLLKAYREGAIVIWDEMNSSSSMERLLNGLLMKIRPGEAAPKPGFFLIGTQNPSTMPGRHDTSTAIKHRMHYRILPVYPSEEAVLVLRNIGWAPMDKAFEIIKDFERTQQEGEPLVFRDAIQEAQKVATQEDIADAETEVRAELEKEFKKSLGKLASEEIKKLFSKTSKEKEEDNVPSPLKDKKPSSDSPR